MQISVHYNDITFWVYLLDAQNTKHFGFKASIYVYLYHAANLRCTRSYTHATACTMHLHVYICTYTIRPSLFTRMKRDTNTHTYDMTYRTHANTNASVLGGIEPCSVHHALPESRNCSGFHICAYWRATVWNVSAPGELIILYFMTWRCVCVAECAYLQ